MTGNLLTLNLTPMRKIKFKRYERNAVGVDGKWLTVEGFFHTWGLTFEEFTNGAVGASVGIVEDHDGKVWEISPENIQFLTPPKPDNGK